MTRRTLLNLERLVEHFRSRQRDDQLRQTSVWKRATSIVNIHLHGIKKHVRSLND